MTIKAEENISDKIIKKYPVLDHEKYKCKHRLKIYNINREILGIIEKVKYKKKYQDLIEMVKMRKKEKKHNKDKLSKNIKMDTESSETTITNSVSNRETGTVYIRENIIETDVVNITDNNTSESNSTSGETTELDAFLCGDLDEENVDEEVSNEKGLTLDKSCDFFL